MVPCGPSGCLLRFYGLISYTHNPEHSVQNITRETENNSIFQNHFHFQSYFLAVNPLGYSFKVATLVLIV
jgi:hypothetical protein